MSTTRSLNRLDQKQTFALGQWLVREGGSEAWVREDKPMTARRAASQLGFHVTTNNIDAVSKIAGVRVISESDQKRLDTKQANGVAAEAAAEVEQVIDAAAIAARVRQDLAADARATVSSVLPAMLDQAVRLLRGDLASAHETLLDAVTEQEKKVAQLEQKLTAALAAVEAIKSVRLVP